MKQPILIRIAHESGISIDLFTHFYEDDLVWHGTSAQRWDNKKFVLKDYSFLGRTFKGAEDFDLYLTENYGEGWRFPQVDFDSNFDTPNMSFINSANGLTFYVACFPICAKEQARQRQEIPRHSYGSRRYRVHAIESFVSYISHHFLPT